MKQEQLDWKRLLAGGLTIALALAGLVRVAQALSVEYRFRKVTQQITKDKIDTAKLVEYSLELQKLVRRDPGNGEIRNRYASVLAQLGQYDTALVELTAARKTLNTRNSLFFMADMNEKLGHIAEAEQAMADCLTINPTDVEFNPGWLHLLSMRIYELSQQKDPRNQEQIERYRRQYAEAALNWSIRATSDKNAYLFLGNYYLNPPYPIQAYRCFLMGLSGASWLNMNARSMIDENGARFTVSKILENHYAKPHQGLP